MKLRQFFYASLIVAAVPFSSCNNADNKTEPEMKEPKLKEENVTYNGDNVTMNGFVVYDENKEGAKVCLFYFTNGNLIRWF